MDEIASNTADLLREIESLTKRVRELEERAPSASAPGGPAERRGLYEQFFEMSPVGLVCAGLDGRWLAANDRFCEMVGYRREELAGMSWRNITPEGDLPEELSRYREFLVHREEGATFQERYVRKDGFLLDVEVRARLVRTPDGKPRYVLAVVQDITDRLRAEAATRESERLLRHIIDLVPHFIFAKDEESRFLLANRAVADAYGTTVTNIVGKSDIDFSATPEEAEHFHADDLAVIRGGTPKIVPEEPITDSSGRVRWLQTIKIPFRYGPEETPAILGVATDITERKLTLDALRESESRYRLIAEHVADVIWTLDLDLRFTYVSPSMLRLRGYTSEEAMTQWLGEVLTPSSLRRAMEVLAEEFARESAGDADPRRSRTIDLEAYRRDGGTLWTSNEIAFLRDDSGRAIGLVGVTRDVTAERRAAEALRESEERYRRLFETSAIGFFLMTDVFLDCNEQVCRLWRCSREDIIGHSPAEFSPPQQPDGSDSTEAAMERIRAAFEGHRQSFLWQHRRRDGTLMDAEITLQAVSISDRQLLVATMRDVTERRLLEEQLRQAQKMEAIGQLAGGVAHDFNNVLQVITGYLELAMGRLEPGRSPWTELEQVAQAAARATALVRQLLAFSRRETVRLEDLDLDRVIDGTTTMLRRVIGEHIELEASSRGRPPRVHADPRLIEHVLLNLCVNARDAMPEGGRIAIVTDSVSIDRGFVAENPWAREGSFAVVSVVDSGAGMAKEVLEHVFEPFFTTKAVGKGTGLGLATVYGIVRQHGGFVRVESEVGRGTAFRIYLPEAGVERADRDSPDGPESAAPPARGNDETILLAEDEEAVRNLAVDVLERAGYRVLAARDGVEALDIFSRAREEIDLVILDAVMPRKSGRAAYDEMKASDPETRVLFCSGYSFGSLDAQPLAEEGTDILQKPFAPTDLLSRVREILDRTR